MRDQNRPVRFNTSASTMKLSFPRPFADGAQDLICNMLSCLVSCGPLGFELVSGKGRIGKEKLPPTTSSVC
jgi:hypothetical protein